MLTDWCHFSIYVPLQTGALDKLTLDRLYDSAIAQGTPYYAQQQPASNPFMDNALDPYTSFQTPIGIPPPTNLQMVDTSHHVQQGALVIHQPQPGVADTYNPFLSSGPVQTPSSPSKPNKDPFAGLI